MSAYPIAKGGSEWSACFGRIRWLVAPVLMWAVIGTEPASAQSVFAYPKAGQSQQQQMKDQTECRQWAMRQTGYNPSAPVSPSGGGYG